MAYMSQEGYDKLKAEIKHLEEVERPEVIRQIAEAREKGDLSENAEYDAAKEAQGKLEAKINQLKLTLMDAKILDSSKIKTDAVQILSKVEMKNVKTGATMTYTLVSESEANLRENKISVKTPIAQGLLGKKVGDIVSIRIPQGTIELEIVNISEDKKNLISKEEQAWQQYFQKLQPEKFQATSVPRTRNSTHFSTSTR